MHFLENYRTGCRLATLAAAFLSGHAFAGGMTSGGGDLRAPETGSAWFLGEDQPIRACLRLADDFVTYDRQYQGVEGMRALVEEQFAMWTKYISDRHVNRREALFRSSTSLSLSPQCAGNEELVFYFGVSNNETNLYKARFENPASFAVRTSYDLATGRGQGLLWFANPRDLNRDIFPDLRETKFLRTLIGHELGHVFGVSHEPGTVMDEDIVKVIKAWEQAGIPAGAPESIDWEHELVWCNDCERQYRGLPPPPELFKKLTGREPIDPKMSIVRQDRYGLTLELRDAVLGHTFSVLIWDGQGLDPRLFESARRYDIFRAARIESNGVVRTLSADKTGMVVHTGYVEGPSDKGLELLVVRNARNARPLKIVVIDKGGTATTLFEGLPFAG